MIYFHFYPLNFIFITIIISILKNNLIFSQKNNNNENDYLNKNQDDNLNNSTFHFNNSIYQLNQHLENNFSLSSSKSSYTQNSSFNKSIAKEVLMEIFKYLYSNSNSLIFLNDVILNKQCNQSIYNDLNDDDILSQLINYSGKGFSDIGLEKECKNNNFYYLFIELKVSTSVFFNNTEYFYLYAFLEQNSFFTGLCLPNACTDFYSNFLDKKINQKFFKFLNNNYGIVDIANYSIYPEKKETLFFYFFLFMFIYITFKILISIIGVFVFKVLEAHREKNTEDDDDDNNLEDSSYESSAINEKNYNENFIFSTKKKSTVSDKRKDYSKLKKLFYNIYKILSFRSNLKLLYKVKNNFYDDTKIEYISFFRILLLFWIIFNHNIYALIKIPHRLFTNYNFFTSIWFTIIKYSTFSSECWVVLDGLITSYKLMSYLKKHNEKNTIIKDYSFKVFFKFYLIATTKFCLFYFTFFFIHVYLREITLMLKKSPILNYYITNINDKRECQANPYLMFIPFYIQYLGINNKVIGFRNCYRYVNIFMNEFYCFTLVLIIFYIAFNLKRRLFDFFISFLLILNICLSFLSYTDDVFPSGEFYSLSYVLGDTLSLTYTHLFINIYSIGIFGGLVYFYYNDIISSNPLMGEDYIPFNYTYTIMKFFDKSGRTLQKTFFFTSILLQILFSMSFYFFILFFSDNPVINTVENNFSIKVNNVIKLLYIYEKKIFLILFMVMLLSVLINKKITSLLLFIQSNLFIPFNRIDFACFCVLDTCVYIFHSAFNIEIFLNQQNMFLITIGLLVYISVIASVMWLLFELPFRIVIKKLISNRIQMKLVGNRLDMVSY